MNSLLPPNATQLERDLETVANRATVQPVPIPALWDWETCPADLLPWLAWTFSVDYWDSNWSEDQKRQSIKESYAIHVRKGTVDSIRRVLQAAGYGNATIIETEYANLYNGNLLRNGQHNRKSVATRGFMYRVHLQRPISINQAIQVKKILENTAPIRSHLVGLHYREALHLHNNTIHRNGEFTRGTV